jgi:peptidoglycan hydrolase-like protein with peptidoglycan-binding domain
MTELPPSGRIAIFEAVGQGPLARNRPSDVKTIQEALNQVTVLGQVGGPLPFLVVDGVVGPKTQAAILNFQQVQVASIHADGLVEPNKQTIKRLNEIVAPASEFDLNAKLATALPLVRAALAAAVQNVTAVITSGPGAAGLAAVAADRLNRHFKLGTLDVGGQSTGRVNLFGTYQEMALLVNQPELFNLLGAVNAFDLDSNTGNVALAAVQGVFEPPVVDGKANRARQIHLGVRFFAPDVNADFASFILLHEIGHFVSRRDGEIIDDFGRGWFDDLFIKPLPAAKRLLNADSYASFAHECRTGSAAKPAFVKTAPGGLGGSR